MKSIAIIPARGGSKRIPRKNIKNFLGKPIISYSIEKAIASGIFEEVMVSTDDDEIAEIAIKLGANVPFKRSEENSSDSASTIEVINEVLANYNSKGISFDYSCCIYPTSPLMQIEDLHKGFNLLVENDFEVVFPIVSFSYPIWRGIEMGQNGKSSMIWKEFEKTRSQDLKKVYHDTGQWYWLKNKKVLHSLLNANTGSIEISEMLVQDIDNETDWKLAEMKYKILNQL